MGTRKGIHRVWKGSRKRNKNRIRKRIKIRKRKRRIGPFDDP